MTFLTPGAGVFYDKVSGLRLPVPPRDIHKYVINTQIHMHTHGSTHTHMEVHTHPQIRKHAYSDTNTVNPCQWLTVSLALKDFLAF